MDGTLNQAAKYVERGDLVGLEKLVQSGLDINGAGEHGFNLLYWAMRSQEIDSFEKLLILGANSDQVWDDGDSVTFTAAGVKDVRYLELALKFGANVNQKHRNNLKTPLFNALEPNDFSHMELLIEAGADVNAVDSIGNTAMMNAAALNYYGVVEYLLKNGGSH